MHQSHQADGPRDGRSPQDDADDRWEGADPTDAMVAVVRRSSYDPEALTGGAAEMTRFERVHAAQPGYAGNVVVDLGEGERIVVTLWASEEHASAARTALAPVVRELLGPLERAPSQLLGVGRVISTDLEAE